MLTSRILQLELGRVAGDLGLDDALDGPVGCAHDAPVPARVVEHHGRHRRRGPARARAPARARRSSPRLINGWSPLSTIAVAPGSMYCAAAWTASAVPRGSLLDRHLGRAVERLLEPPLRPVDDHHHAGAGLVRGGDGPLDHRPPAQRVQQLRRGGAHPGALPRGKDDDDGRLTTR